MTLGKSAPKAPAAPDPAATAAAQTQSNIETARKNAELNRVNQVTPQGSLTYSKTNPAWDENAYLAANPDVAANIKGGGYKSGLDHFTHAGQNESRSGVAAGFVPGGEDQWTATTTLSPEQKKLYDLSTQAQTLYGETGLAQLGKLREQMSTPFQFKGAPDYQNVASRAGQVQTTLGPEDYSADRTRVEEALYGRLDPSLQQQRTGLEARLRSQGLAPGSEAWTNAMRAQAQTENDARLGVTTQGLQEQQGLFNMALARAGFGNTAVGQQQNLDLAAGTYGQQSRQQMLAEQLAIRNQPLNETSALLTGSQVQNPTFQNVPQVQVAPTDYIGAVGQQQAALQNAFNAKNANYQANISGMYSLGGSLINGGTSLATGGMGGGGGMKK